MKKMFPLLLVLLLLSGCARTAEPPAVPEKAGETEPIAETAAPEAARETESIAETAAPEEETPMRGEKVTLNGEDSYLRLTLPEGWDWTEGETVEDRASLVLTPRTNDGFRVELVHWAFFGICGTGVEFSDYTLPDGRTATLAVEKSDGQVWWTLILPESPDKFTIQFGAPQSVIDAHQAELDEMLDSLQLGELSHIPPQPVVDR